MTNEELIVAIGKMLPEAETKQGTQYVETTVPLARFHVFMKELKQDKSLSFDYLFCLTGMDHAEHLQVIYHLESVDHKHILVVKVNTEGRETPVIETVSNIWPTAESHENEVFDLFGIRFNNHPELRRLFLDENWGFPLRKDYKDDIHIVSR